MEELVSSEKMQFGYMHLAVEQLCYFYATATII